MSWGKRIITQNDENNAIDKTLYTRVKNSIYTSMEKKDLRKVIKQVMHASLQHFFRKQRKVNVLNIRLQKMNMKYLIKKH